MPNTNTDKNVYILGAGFSKELGIPLQDDFLQAAKDIYFQDTGTYKHFDRVFNYQDKLSKMRKFLSCDLFNLEQLFNLLEMDIFYSKDPKAISVKNDFLSLINDTLAKLTPTPYFYNPQGALKFDYNYQNYRSFISMFVQNDNTNKITTHNDTIISFNYDLVIEAATSVYNWDKECGITGKNHLLNSTDNPYLNLNVMFEKENFEVKNIAPFFKINRNESHFPPRNLFSNSDSAIKLLKLHGSINWTTTNNNKPYIVPPIWNKSDPKVRKLWNIAYKELVEAERIIIIGYSFPETDIYVKSLLALALNENKKIQHIYFINPDTKKVKETYSSLIDTHFKKSCAYKEWTFSEFMTTHEGRDFIRDELSRTVR